MLAASSSCARLDKRVVNHLAGVAVLSLKEVLHDAAQQPHVAIYPHL
jgi:hypothetical protein